MADKGRSQKLKEQNRWQLWLIIAANAVVFYGACQWQTFELSGLKAALAGAANLLPVGFAVVVTTIANGLLSSPIKDRLVFLRWHYALPGHRAFGVHAKADPRIDFTRLQRACGNKIPTDPKAENSLWYRFYLEVQNVPAVLQVHRDFLALHAEIGHAINRRPCTCPWRQSCALLEVIDWLFLGVKGGNIVLTCPPAENETPGDL
jgi:hypothetical protein